MVTLTLSVDPDVLRRARIRALQRNESVNKYLSDVLERYARADDTSAIESLLAMALEHDSASGDGERGWRRDDLYDV
ncbi:hypothetical protein [Georgenia sp. Z1491]|uniref:hypothetical protein n=1 Tax=Georgenia sp. Z1491 TaxID=3416707 RepID=UPI003CE96CAA